MTGLTETLLLLLSKMTEQGNAEVIGNGYLSCWLESGVAFACDKPPWVPQAAAFQTVPLKELNE